MFASSRRRRGSILILSAFLLVAMIAVLALALDTGYMMSARTDQQRSADSAALAGAGALVNGTPVATQEVLNYLAKNKVGTSSIAAADATIEFGYWDPNTRTFTQPGGIPSAVRVNVTSQHQPLFFARIFARDQFTVSSKAVCVCQPRDIAMVLDYSGSMAYDSQFKNLGLLPQAEIETNLQQIWTELGSPVYGKLKWAPKQYGSVNQLNSDVLKKFKLDTVAFPFPGGSWSEYVDYVQTDSYIQAAGYQTKYGMLTFVHYMLARHGSHDDCPNLWKTSEQPVTCLKDAVDDFIGYLQAHSTDDQIALSLYTYSDSTAILESKLTKDLTKISTLCRQRQAGHYIGGTNISAGMTKARTELVSNARIGSKKLMLLMTDGVVNLPTGNTTSDKAAVIAEANLAAAAKIPIVTISLGAYADTALMQQVADITGGYAFVVPGGQSIAQVKAQLEAVFAQVAASRPLKLVE